MVDRSLYSGSGETTPIVDEIPSQANPTASKRRPLSIYCRPHVDYMSSYRGPAQRHWRGEYCHYFGGFRSDWAGQAVFLRNWGHFNSNRRSLAESGPKLADMGLGPNSGRIRPNWTKFAQAKHPRLILARRQVARLRSQTWAGIPPQSAKCGRNRSNLGRSRSRLARTQPAPSPEPGFVWQTSTEICQHWASAHFDCSPGGGTMIAPERECKRAAMAVSDF